MSTYHVIRLLPVVSWREDLGKVFPELSETNADRDLADAIVSERVSESPDQNPMSLLLSVCLDPALCRGTRAQGRPPRPGRPKFLSYSRVWSRTSPR